MVATSDDGEKSEIELSTDWCVAIEHWRSSSIKDYLCQLSKLANYSVTTSLIYKLIV